MTKAKNINERITRLDEEDLMSLLDKYAQKGYKPVRGLSVDPSIKVGQQRAVYNPKIIDGYSVQFGLAGKPSKKDGFSGQLTAPPNPKLEFIIIFGESISRSESDMTMGAWTVEDFELNNIVDNRIYIGRGRLSSLLVKAIVARPYSAERTAAEKKEKEDARAAAQAKFDAEEAARQKAYDDERAKFQEVKGFGIGGMKPGQKCKFSGSYTSNILRLDFPCSTHVFELELSVGIRGTMDLPETNPEPGVTDTWTFDEMELNNMVGNKVYFAEGRNYKVLSMKAKPKSSEGLKESTYKYSESYQILKEHNNNKKVHPLVKGQWWYDA